MIQAIISIFGIIRGLFVAGGLVARFFGWLSSSFGWIATALYWIGDLLRKFLFGTAVAFKRISVYLAAYYLVELARRLLFVTFIVVVFGWIIDYAVNNVIVYGGKTITLLFNEFITSINSFGALGHNLLALMIKIGFFDSLSLFMTVMIYTLISRVALSILFK